VELRRVLRQGDAVCFGDDGLPRETRLQLGRTLEALLSGEPAALDQWLAGACVPPVEDRVAALAHAGLRLSPRLPVCVAAAYLQRLCPAVPEPQLRCLANLYQVVLEVSRDAGLLQSLFRLYAGLGLPVCLADLGVRWDDPQFLVMGEVLARACCRCPYDTSPQAWQLAARKVENWGLKHSGRCTPETMLRDLLAWPAVRECEAAVRGMRPRRICVIGHSFTQSGHWASPASFTDLAADVLRRFNSGIEVLHLSQGGQTASTVRSRLLGRALEARPDLVLIAVVVREPEHLADLRAVIAELRRGGAEVMLFDTLNSRFGHEEVTGYAPAVAQAARAAGARVIEVGAHLAEHPWRGRFEALDVRHMGPAYHRVMAVELVRYLAGQAGGARPPA
jgi:hypothetical protein